MVLKQLRGVLEGSLISAAIREEIGTANALVIKHKRAVICKSVEKVVERGNEPCQR